jgi:hypothetical protein
VQMEQQVMVSGAERTLFMASKWIGDSLDEERHCWHYPDLDLRAKIIAGWDQFAIDLAAYVLPPAIEAAPVSKSPDTLPALRIEITGQVTASNLAEFKATALAAIKSVNRDLKTDADFADADKAVKWCADVESRLKAAKEHALSQTSSIDELFKTLDNISAESKAVRLDLAKLVERRKIEVKECAVTAARQALDAHIAGLNAELAPMRLNATITDFAGTIKGLRSIASMQDALDAMLASSKIVADLAAREVRANVALAKSVGDRLEFLFVDLGQIVHKAPEDFAALVRDRIGTHKAAEAAREEKRRADEASRIAAAEQRAREQEAERIHFEAHAIAQRAAQAELAAARAETARLEALADAKISAQKYAPPPGLALAPVARASDPDSAEPATLNLGTISKRLGFTLSGTFVIDVLGVRPAEMAKGVGWYRESQFAVICNALVWHVGRAKAEQEATA